MDDDDRTFDERHALRAGRAGSARGTRGTRGAGRACGAGRPDDDIAARQGDVRGDVGDDGESMVKIYGPGDKAVAGIVANKAGSGEVAVYGEGGTVLAALAEGRTPHTGAAIAADVTGAEAFRVIAGPDGGSACVNRHGNYACIGPTVSFGR